MSHIPIAPSTGRATFDALPQTHSSDVGYSWEYGQGQYRDEGEGFAHGHGQGHYRDEREYFAYGHGQAYYRGGGESLGRGYGQEQYGSAGEGFVHGHGQGQYREQGEGFARVYDRGPHQAPYGDVSPLYDGREYAGVAQFESGGVPLSDYALYRQQSDSGITLTHQAAAQSPQPMYHQYAIPPTGAGAPLPNQPRPNYKPSALRWPFLSLLFIALVAFIGLLAYAMYALPQRDILPELFNSTSKQDIVRRQVGGAIEIVHGTANYSSPGAPKERDYSEVSGIMVTHLVTMMQAHRSSHDGYVGKRTNSVSVSTQTTPEIVPTRSKDDSGDSSTTGPPVIITTRPPGDYGDISVTVTESTPPSTDVRPPGDYGDISVTVTSPPKRTNSASVPTQTTPQTLPTRPVEDYGDVSVTETRPVEDYGDVSVTETIPPPTRPPDDFGDVSATETVPPGTRPPDDFGDVSATETVPPVGTRPPGDFGNVDPVITTLTVNPTDHGDVEVVQTLALTPTLAVETDANGVPTATRTEYPSFTSVIPTSHTTVLTNSLGQPTGTVVTDALVTPSVAVETDSNGIPTATRTSYGIIPTKESEPSVVVKVKGILTYGDYFIGMFLPTILAMAISIPIRILDLNVKLLQPWHELTKPGGASGRRSLCLETGGWRGLINAVRWIFGGQVLIVLTTSLFLGSALLVPLSAEAIAFDLQGTCVKGSGKGSGCEYVVSVFREAAGATLALLGLMAMMVFTILIYLVKWQSGVGTNPWSICGIASLSLNEDVRNLFPSHVEGGAAGKPPDKLMKSLLKDRFFTLGYFHNSDGGLEYGVMLQENDAVEPYLKGARDENAPPLNETHLYDAQTHAERKPHQPLFMLKYAGRALLLMLLCGILGLILYYNNTGGETAFEHFMMSESFGVRFLFSGVGFIIMLCWSSFFHSVAAISPYHLLAQAPRSARRSILLARPTNEFSGLWSAVRRRDGFLAVVALTSVLSEFLPVLLAQIPFRVSQTYLVHLITTWSAVGILCIMLLVLVASFFVKWPHMPLDPTTVAGAMYYVADSWMLGGFDGLGTLGPKDRDRRVVALGLKYRFGQMTGVSGETRVGVDVAGDHSSVAGW